MKAKNWEEHRPNANLSLQGRGRDHSGMASLAQVNAFTALSAWG